MLSAKATPVNLRLPMPVTAGGQDGFATPGDVVEDAEAGRPRHSQILFLLEH